MDRRVLAVLVYEQVGVVLPQGFHRIRHYGLFANGGRTENLARARELLGMPAPEADDTHSAPPPRKSDSP